LHTPIGKVSFTEEQLEENARTFLQEVMRLRPPASKGLYVRSATMSSTMGPPVAIDRSTVLSLVR